MNILIVNLHAMSNRGDAAIMAVTLDMVRKAFPDANITLAVNNVEEFQNLAVEVVPSFKTWAWSKDEHGHAMWHPLHLFLLLLAAMTLLCWRFTGHLIFPCSSSKRTLLQAYTTADVVVNCGGNTLYARHKLALAFWIIWFSQLCGPICNKPLICLPQTVGPFYLKIHALAAATLLKQAKLIMVRDSPSYKLVTQELAVSSQQCVLTPDLALYLENHQREKPSEQAISKRLIGISVIDWGTQYPHFHRQEEYEQAIAATVSTLLKDGYQVAFFSQSDTSVWGEDDTIPAQRIIKQLSPEIQAKIIKPLIVPQEPKQFLSFYGQFYLVIATRLHATILALVANTPVVPIAYTTKSWGFVDDLNLRPITLDIENVTSDALIDTVHSVLEQRFEWQQRNQASLQEKRENCDIISLLQVTLQS
jgi:colanic acid/amylovoran biosynthesis protein